MNIRELLRKYDVQAPRYTSYPTVPYWCDSPTPDQWISSLKSAMENSDTRWSMYLHIPFCETLCTYCGCNTSITRNHGVESPYVDTLLRELDLYLEKVPDLSKRPLRELHLGGGTPTFLSAANLKRLLDGIFSRISAPSAGFEASIEVDPRHTNEEQLRTLYALGFRRISLGVQDYNPEIQRLVNRIQPVEQTFAITRLARAIGFTSVNHDLIFGLPRQGVAEAKRTAELTAEIQPDRIALYSYAHVPWIKAAQRLFDESDLPQGEAKRELYEVEREILLAAGYVEIGMDHFALPSDSLFKAHEQGQLHRNFMGYTHQRTEVLLGLGVSAISEAPDCFHQNEKVLPVYETKLAQNQLTTLRGHRLSAEDRKHREQILRLMTTLSLEIESDAELSDVKSYLTAMEKDGLVRFVGKRLLITPEGKPFLRNACMAFDQRLRGSAPDRLVFSRSI